jgi:integrase
MQLHGESLSILLSDCNAKLGKVKITVNNNSLRLQWTVKGLKRFNPTVGKATLDNLNRAFILAKEIELDISKSIFDPSLNKYGLKTNSLNIVGTNVVALPVTLPKLPNILELWQWYKSIQERVVSKSTINVDWRSADRLLSLLPQSALELLNADQLVQFLRSKNCNKGKGYSEVSIYKFLKRISPALNLALDMGKIPKDTPNLYAVWLDESRGLFKLPPKKKVRIYSTDQIKLIIQAFENNTYYNPHGRKDVKDSYYTNFVYFRFLTGLRPSECVALQWADIVWDNEQPKQVIIRQRKVAGCDVEKGLKTTRKTKITARVIPCNNQLKNLILAIRSQQETSGNKEQNNPHDLLFPACEGGYINSNNFNRRQWHKVIDGLIKDGLLPYFIPFYDERHCFGTHITRKGTDLKTTSAIMGNSVPTLIESYLAVDDHEDFIPEI